MKTLSVFDSNEDITNFVQGKIRVSDMNIFYKWNTNVSGSLLQVSKVAWQVILLLAPFRIGKNTHMNARISS
jgi:hypothetical protein